MGTWDSDGSRPWLRRLATLAVAGVIVLTALVFWLFGTDPVPEVSEFDLGLEELRDLAGQQGLPVEVRSELVAVTTMPKAAVYAGFDFEPMDFHHTVFQIRFRDGRTILIDSGMDQATAERMSIGIPPRFFADAFERVQRALNQASDIVITHEHADHLQGLVGHAAFDDVAKRVRLTEEQVASERWNAESGLDAAKLRAFELHDYEGAVALAPGVVVKKAPGHSPGSQLVFVRLASGRELLFVGDLAWNRDALENLSYRPRIITELIIDEDSLATRHQFRAMHDLMASGELEIVVSHDPRERARLGIDVPFE